MTSGPVFGASWPGPATPPSSTLLVATALAGLVAAAAVPEGRPGVGWPVTALAITVAALAVGWHTRRSLPPLRGTLTGAAWTGAALALAAMSALRDAEWLVTLSLLAACGAGSIAVAGRSFRGVFARALAVPVAGLRGLPWAGRGLLSARWGGGRQIARLILAGLVGLLLVVVFGGLFVAADAAFARVVGDLVPGVDVDSAIRWVILFLFGTTGVVGAGFLLSAPPVPPAPSPVRAPRLRGLEWTLPVGLLVALFALFVGVQFVTLFGSDAHVRRTTGLTYAEYARSGFWQLLMVTVLALGVILIASRTTPQASPTQRIWKRGLLAGLALLTLVVVASALGRMWLYQQAYGFTVLRLLVATCEMWLGVGFVLVLVAVLRLRPGNPARGMVTAGVLALLALGVLDAERFVAERNVARYTATGELDMYYLSELSTDAVPALLRLPEPQRSCTLSMMAVRQAAGLEEDWRSANLSRAAARSALVDADC